MSENGMSNVEGGLSRRAVLGTALATAGAATSMLQGPWGIAAAADPVPGNSSPSKRYAMKKSINLWAFPYSNPFPNQWTLEKCLRVAKDAGFDGIELNYDLDSDLSPKSGTKESSTPRKPHRSAKSPRKSCRWSS